MKKQMITTTLKYCLAFTDKTLANIPHFHVLSIKKQKHTQFYELQKHQIAKRQYLKP